ncbi:MAG: hypothetical protein CL917_13185 [Deltaproteobacteria bacterium]|nr:hypothetical protein [Deltaproteobacteria bacterium]
MESDFKNLLWAMKIGAFINIYLIIHLLTLPTPDLHVVIPALILLSVSAFRCLFPNRYLKNIVFHDHPLSSIFLTRLLATFSEVAYIYQFSYVIRIFNTDQIVWIDFLSWIMVVQVSVSQAFVWSAILTKNLRLYFYEEIGWFIIFLANTGASLFLYLRTETSEAATILLLLNLLFGVGYLPWQILHLRSLRTESREGTPDTTHWKTGLTNAIRQRTQSTQSSDWGGTIGLTWMVAYWVTLIPIWVQQVAIIVSSR